MQKKQQTKQLKSKGTMHDMTNLRAERPESKQIKKERRNETNEA